MAVTFETTNDDHILQVDDEHKALSLIDVRTLTLTNRSNLFYERFVIATSVAPLVAVRNIANIFVICTGIKAVVGGYEVCIVGSGVGQVKVYSFGQVPITQSTLGLQLFNAKEELTFDALSKWIKVVALYTRDYNGTNIPPTLATGRQYAFAGCSLERGWSEAAFWFDNYWTGDGSAYCTAIRLEANNTITAGEVNTAAWIINESDPNYPGDQDYRWDAVHQGTFSTYMLLDVTGY